ncbi:MAG: 7-carboxy-7-deazaguanine synthase QueE [Flavobacteriaceae bacterium]|nr:7-carboxy-7-deazaguanine synthase QueE [Flavobacteriaceae bacterium]MBL6684007.1 7-carboxy-7-deazaguanine synthase QueE [Flavobacteriaceae bacterium]|tara:strand:- start:1311 stop:1928 length:618 start_codon:yes stop_codon:yes gene_type:complete
MTKKYNFLTKLPVMEKFYTIQGEGYYSGQPFYFIRLGGCDVGCHWCDVKESWDHNQHQFIEVNDLIKDVKEHTSNVVITGGEPLMWDLSELTKRFKENNIKLHLETSGAYELSGNWDWVCLSPKKKMLPKKEFYSMADELKVVIYNNDDFKFAIQESEKVSQECKLFLQPEWSKFDLMKDKIVQFVMKNKNWNISLQTHKYLEID